MIRQRALAWAAVLALVVAVQIASLPIRPSASIAATLAQGTPTVAAGAPTDLAVVALHCAEAPAAEALTSFFATGASPTGCAPAVGVSIAVMENGIPLAGSPFTTDTAGTLGVRVGLGSAVTLREDPNSLPSGYEPLTQEANGVPYANPVQLDSAAAGTAALFVNVPASVAATLAQGTPAVVASAPTDLVDAVTPSTNAVGRTATATLTFTPTPDRTGCDPAYPDARTCIPPGPPLDAPCSLTDERNFTVLPPDPRGLDADGDGIGCEPFSLGGGSSTNGANVKLYAGGDSPRPADPISNGHLTVVGNRDRVGNGVWVLPRDRHRADDWLVHGDDNRGGLWTWSGHNREDTGFWLNRIAIGNLTVARSGNGNLAIVSNPVFIGNGLWTWSGHNREDTGFWLNRIAIGNLTVARSGNGNLAIVSNPVFIGNGLWTWSGHNREDNWLAPGGTTRDHGPDVEPRTINGGLAVESPPTKLEQASNNEQPTLTINGALSVALPADSVAPPSDAAVAPPPDAAVAPPLSDAGAPPTDAVQPPAAVESPPSDAAVEPPPSDAAVAPPPDAAVAPPLSDAGAPPADAVQPPAAVESPPAAAVESPPSDAAVEPPPSDAAVEPPPSDNSVAPPLSDAGAPDPGTIAPDPVNVGSGVDPGNVMPDPINIGPGNGDVGNGDFSTIAPVPVNVAPDNSAPDLGIAPGSGDFGNGAPDPINVAPGNSAVGVDPGNVAPDPDVGHSERGQGDG